MIKKGIILELHDKKAVVMNTKGQFDEINATPSMEVGDEIQYGDNSQMKVIATLCMLLVMFSSVFGFNFLANQRTPVSYVAVDINPGVEFTVNIYNEVISVSPTNQDGELVLAGLDYKGQKIEDATRNFIDEVTKMGYIDPQKEDNAVMITVVNDNEVKAVQLQESLYTAVNEFFVDNHILGVILGEETNEVLRTEAQKEGVSAGKLRLIKQAVKADPTLTQEVAVNMPVKELNKVIEAKEAPALEKSEDELLAEKESAIMSVMMSRSMLPMTTDGEDVDFNEKLNDYQNQKKDEAANNAWEEVNKDLETTPSDTQEATESDATTSDAATESDATESDASSSDAKAAVDENKQAETKSLTKNEEAAQTEQVDETEKTENIDVQPDGETDGEAEVEE